MGRRHTDEELDAFARVAAAMRADFAHTLQAMSKAQPKPVMHAACMGFIQACDDYLRVTFGPETAAMALYALADRAAARTAATPLTNITKGK